MGYQEELNNILKAVDWRSQNEKRLRIKELTEADMLAARQARLLAMAREFQTAARETFRYYLQTFPNLRLESDFDALELDFAISCLHFNAAKDTPFQQPLILLFAFDTRPVAQKRFAGITCVPLAGHDLPAGRKAAIAMARRLDDVYLRQGIYNFWIRNIDEYYRLREGTRAALQEAVGRMINQALQAHFGL